jgi:hypothetical protein
MPSDMSGRTIVGQTTTVWRRRQQRVVIGDKWFFEHHREHQGGGLDVLLPQMRRLLQQGGQEEDERQADEVDAGLADDREDEGGSSEAGDTQAHHDVEVMDEATKGRRGRLFDVAKDWWVSTEQLLEDVQCVLKPSSTFLPPHTQAPCAGGWWAFQHPLQQVTQIMPLKRKRGGPREQGVGTSITIKDMCLEVSPDVVASTKWMHINRKGGYLRLMLGERGRGKECVPIWEHAHRLVLWALQGPPTADQLLAAQQHVQAGGRGKRLVVCHTCSNTLCLNPLHLVYGSTWENTRQTGDPITSGVDARSGVTGVELGCGGGIDGASGSGVHAAAAVLAPAMPQGEMQASVTGSDDADDPNNTLRL